MDPTQVVEEYPVIPTPFLDLDPVKVEAVEELITPDTVQSETTCLETQISEQCSVQLQFQCLACHIKFCRQLDLHMHICLPFRSNQTTAIGISSTNNEELESPKNLVEVKNEVECKSEVFLEECNTVCLMDGETGNVDSCEPRNQDTWPCYMCHVDFPTALDLQVHLNLTQNQCQLQSTNNQLIDSDVISTTSGEVKRESMQYPTSTAVSSFTPDKPTSTNANNLNIHKEITVGRNSEQFVCRICGAGFQSSRSLTCHVRFHRRGKKRMEIKPVKNPVVEKKDPPKGYQCTVCEEKFNTIAILNKHVGQKRHGVKLRFQCSVCPEAFSNKYGLGRHLQNIHVVKTFPSSHGLSNTNNLEPGPNNPHADQCECIMCTDLGAGEKLWECKTCEKKFERKKKLTKHEKITGHGMMSQPAACPICSTVFRTHGLMRTHVLKVHADQTYPCKVCQDSFSREDSYQKHFIVQGGTQKIPYECNSCSAKFTKRIKLKEPTYISTTNRNGSWTHSLQCNHCSLNFTQKDFLTKHLRYVHGTKAFQCALCHYMCGGEDSYQKHMSQHAAVAARELDLL